MKCMPHATFARIVQLLRRSCNFTLGAFHHAFIIPFPFARMHNANYGRLTLCSDNPVIVPKICLQLPVDFQPHTKPQPQCCFQCPPQFPMDFQHPAPCLNDICVSGRHCTGNSCSLCPQLPVEFQPVYFSKTGTTVAWFMPG